ncbi:uncharacterized protein LOC110400001 [Numida meleagris]|uniref:uncharacterized protein LOC110400001 n=1 Tax=Numida meleagris TaxID=8996 RepID=UPI000B3D89A1|nr:uncharacterized protein LOC110400001 [Numida meleagris]
MMMGCGWSHCHDVKTRSCHSHDGGTGCARSSSDHRKDDSGGKKEDKDNHRGVFQLLRDTWLPAVRFPPQGTRNAPFAPACSAARGPHAARRKLHGWRFGSRGLLAAPCPLAAPGAHLLANCSSRIDWAGAWGAAGSISGRTAAPGTYPVPSRSSWTRRSLHPCPARPATLPHLSPRPSTWLTRGSPGPLPLPGGTPPPTSSATSSAAAPAVLGRLNVQRRFVLTLFICMKNAGCAFGMRDAMGKNVVVIMGSIYACKVLRAKWV